MTEEYLSQFESAVIYHKNEFDSRCVYLRKGKPWEFATSLMQSEVDNIYYAKVTKLAWSLGGVFADIGLSTSVLIENCDLQVGASVIVQIKQDRYAEKEYKATTNICIRKGAVLYFPCDTGEKRLHLEEKVLADSLNTLSSRHGGRFSLKGYYKKLNSDIVISDALKAVDEWRAIIADIGQIKKPTLLKRGDDEAKKLLLNVISDCKILFTNDDCVMSLIEEEFPFVDLQFVDDEQLFPLSFLDKEVSGVNNKKVSFKNGSLVFDYTEAFTAIDVNSEGVIGRLNEKPWLQTNLSAAKEIARQLRLRNIGGAIVVDFISMESFEDQTALLETLCDASINSLNVRVYKKFTNLGHVELTRKRSGERKDKFFLINGQDNGVKAFFELYRSLRELKNSTGIKEATVYITDELLATIEGFNLFDRINELKIKLTYEKLPEKGFIYKLQI